MAGVFRDSRIGTCRTHSRFEFDGSEGGGPLVVNERAGRRLTERQYRYGLVQVGPAGNWVLPSGRVAWKPQVVLAPPPRVVFWPEMPRAVTV